MEPTKKAFEIDAILEIVTGKNRIETIQQNRCMVCEGEADIFRNKISEMEYTISGMCQQCQDSIFGAD